MRTYLYKCIVFFIFKSLIFNYFIVFLSNFIFFLHMYGCAYILIGIWLLEPIVHYTVGELASWPLLAPPTIDQLHCGQLSHNTFGRIFIGYTDGCTCMCPVCGVQIFTCLPPYITQYPLGVCIFICYLFKLYVCVRLVYIFNYTLFFVCVYLL